MWCVKWSILARMSAALTSLALKLQPRSDIATNPVALPVFDPCSAEFSDRRNVGHEQSCLVSTYPSCRSDGEKLLDTRPVGWGNDH